MGRRRDALLALVVLVPVAAAIVALDAPVTPLPVAVGAGGSLALEALLSLRAARVRAVWERPAVQAAALVLGGGLSVLAVLRFGPAAATALAAGLCAYLLVLAVATLRDALGGPGSESPPSDGRRPPRE
ncbi:hypothetical protein [Halogeometricum luteum]|uniref:Uncharacterized protein n=1 Tax=Halogeometricum luteum TaxID=2950537 RepID=A0ABU2FXA3_9EURY|nr:hypothetical protein [Halogeometricum sp. S3BR5-2]MDS0293171.1 hypothetical protein [Halogeometricum sp. S3BR5-2]